MGQIYRTEVKENYDSLIKDLAAKLPDFCQSYVTYLKNEKGIRTAYAYLTDIRKFVDYLEGSSIYEGIDFYHCDSKTAVEKITYQDILTYLELNKHYEKMDGDKAILYETSQAAIARTKCSLRSFFSYYASKEDCSTTLQSKIDAQKVMTKPIVYLDRSQLDKLLEVIYDENLNAGKRYFPLTCKRDYAILVLMVGTGIRVSELVGLDINDVIFTENYSYIYVDRKGGDRDRVYLPPEAIKALQSYIKEGRDILMPSKKTTALFVSTRQERITVRAVQRLVKEYSTLAGIDEQITPHTMRKTFATNLYIETGNIGMVAKALHHSSVDTTNKYYASDDENTKKSASEYIQAALFSKESSGK